MSQPNTTEEHGVQGLIPLDVSDDAIIGLKNYDDPIHEPKRWLTGCLLRFSSNLTPQSHCTEALKVFIVHFLVFGAGSSSSSWHDRVRGLHESGFDTCAS